MIKGVVYTPPLWADWAVCSLNIAEKWLAGAVVMDPGCGEGALGEAVIRRAVKLGHRPTSAEMERLICIDTDTEAIGIFREKLKRSYSLPLPTILNADYLLMKPTLNADIILANPPWVTFGDLEDKRKETYKRIFRNSGLVASPKKLLLGGSRIDIAALFVAVALDRDLARNGEAHFFLPMSLFQGEGAHEAFRRLEFPGGRSYALQELRLLDRGAAFPGAGTRKAFASFKADSLQTWPVSWLTAGPDGSWKPMEAYPADGAGSPLLPVSAGTPPPLRPSISVPPGTKPRQGANPSGAAEAFLVEITSKGEKGDVSVINKKGITGVLPRRWLHPLMDGPSFVSTEPIAPPDEPRRWIFLPYDKSGHILPEDELWSHAGTRDWLKHHEALLKARKGVLLRRLIERGTWWSILGVGPYAFAPWKLAWESYGRESFKPRLFGPDERGIWQGNQALHAYLPFYDEEPARRALQAMEAAEVENYLKALGGANTKTWAQPGRISRILEN